MFFKELTVPEGVTVDIEGNKAKVSGPKGQIEKKLEITADIKIEKIENKIKVSSESERRKVKALVGTVVAHIKNMTVGVREGFTYKLRIVFSHFPVTAKIEGDKILVQNFLGERTPRIAKIVGKTQVKIDNQDITVTGIDIADVSLTASNLEKATRRTGYDKKVFMDGIYITSKGE